MLTELLGCCLKQSGVAGVEFTFLWVFPTRIFKPRVANCTMYMSDIDASVVTSSELFQCNAKTGSKVDSRKLFMSDMAASSVVCSHLSMSVCPP